MHWRANGHWQRKPQLSTSLSAPPVSFKFNGCLPAPQHLVFYAGIAVMAVVGIMDWPVVLTVAIGHTLINVQHNKALQSLGEALEYA